MMVACDYDDGFNKTYTAIYDPPPQFIVLVRVDPYRQKHIDLVKERVKDDIKNDPEYNQIGRAKKKGGRKRW